MKRIMKRYISRLSFKKKLLFFYILVIIVPLLLMEYYLYNSAVVSVSEKYLNTLNQKLESEYTSIKQQLDYIDRIGYLVSTNNIIQKYFIKNYYDDIEIITILNNSITPLFSWFDSTKTASIERFIFLTYNKTIPQNQYTIPAGRYTGQPWLEKVEKELDIKPYYWEGFHTQRDYVSFLPNKNNQVFSLFYPINYNLKSSRTYVEIEVSSRFLFGSLANGQEDRTYDIFVMNGDHHILSQNTSEYGKDITGSNTFRNGLEKAGYGNTFEVKASNSTYYARTIRLKNIDAVLVGIISKANIQKSFNKERYLFIAISLAIIFLFGIISALLANLLVKKLQQIMEAVHKIQNGDFSIHIPIDGSDEVNELAGNINQMSNKIDDLINKNYKTEIAYKEASLAVLQAQINPHFLYNVLETFRMMAVAKGQNEISEGLASLGNIMRYNISLKDDMVTVHNEVENTANYLKIQNLLLNYNLKIDMKIDEKLMDCIIPRFTFQPLVENCIKHGFRGKTGILQIIILIYNKNKNLCFEVKDNGIGITLEKLDEINTSLKMTDMKSGTPQSGHGVALPNINQRFRLKFGEEYGISITSEENLGTTVSGMIPTVYRI